MCNVYELLKQTIRDRPELSLSVSAIKALNSCIEKSQAQTMTEFAKEFEALQQDLLEKTNNLVTIRAGCELFSQTISRMTTETTFEDFKTALVRRTNVFVDNSLQCMDKIILVGLQFIQADSNILVHSYSRVVLHLLKTAFYRNIRFNVFATEAQPHALGFEVARELAKIGLHCTVILDAAVGVYMERMHMVLVGAEGVVENGGVINQIGTAQISTIAKAANKPFYVLAESFKFVRLFPLNQDDFPNNSSAASLYMENKIYSEGPLAPPEDRSHLSDYTPPSGIDLLFTDLGALTPSGVSDELIKFYY